MSKIFEIFYKLNDKFLTYFPYDKSLHFIMGVVLYFVGVLFTFLLQLVTGLEVRKEFVGFFVIILAFLKEYVFDRFSKKGTMDLYDALYTIIGVLLVYLADKM